MPIRLFLAIIVAVLGNVAASAQSACVGGPLNLERLENLLRQEVPEGRVKSLVENCGVAFEPTAETDERLRGVGAVDGVLDATWKAAGNERPSEETPRQSPQVSGPRERPVRREQDAPQRSGTLAPRLRLKVEPEYTPEARQSRISGVVVLSVEIWPDGRAHNIRIVRGIGQGLDEQAIHAVRRWEWAPGVEDGMPVKVTTEVSVSFRLL